MTSEGEGLWLRDALYPHINPPLSLWLILSLSLSLRIFALRHALIWDNSSIADFLMITLGELALGHRHRAGGQQGQRPSKEAAQTQLQPYTHTHTCGWGPDMLWQSDGLWVFETSDANKCANASSAFWEKKCLVTGRLIAYLKPYYYFINYWKTIPCWVYCSFIPRVK